MATGDDARLLLNVFVVDLFLAVGGLGSGPVAVKLIKKDGRVLGFVGKTVPWADTEANRGAVVDEWSVKLG